MYLKKISLLNFKNIAQEELALCPGINCLVGDNGAGKTNIIDAVYYLSMCKSSLAMTDGQSVRHGADFFLAEGQYLTDAGKTESVVCSFSRKGGKVLKRNGKEYERLSDHVGLIPAVIVSPADSALISDAADERRRYLNGFISQLDRTYLAAVMRYNGVLAERNRLLKNMPDETMLRIYDLQLVEQGNRIHALRREFTQRLQPVVADYYRTLSGDREQVELHYKSELNDRPFDELLLAARQKDLANEFTTGRHPPRRPGAENRRLPPAQIRVAGTAEIVPDSPQTGAIHHRRPGKGRKTDPAAGRPLRQARRRARGAVDPPRVRRFVRADLDHRLQPHTAAYDPRQGGRRICAFHGRERGGDAGECNGNGCRGRPGQRIGRKPARECGNGRGCGTDGGKNTGTDRDCGRGSDRRASRGIAGGRTRAAAFGTSPGTGACRRTGSRTRRQRGTPRGCSIGRRTAMRRTKTMLMGDLLEEFFKRPYVAAKVAEGKLPDTWREIVGDRAAEITTELKIENHILYARIQSSVLRSELFYQREALKEEINRRSGVRLVNAVIIR